MAHNLPNDSLSSREMRVLRAVMRAQQHFDGLPTNRVFRRSIADRLLARGLIISAGMAVLCDEDGFAKQPERYAEIYKLTDAGHAAIRRYGETP